MYRTAVSPTVPLEAHHPHRICESYEWQNPAGATSFNPWMAACLREGAGTVT